MGTDKKEAEYSQVDFAVLRCFAVVSPLILLLKKVALTEMRQQIEEDEFFKQRMEEMDQDEDRLWENGDGHDLRHVQPPTRTRPRIVELANANDGDFVSPFKSETGEEEADW